MDSHKRLLSILHLVYGGLGILFFLLINLVISSVLPFILDEIGRQEGESVRWMIDGVTTTIRWVFMSILLLVPIPSIAGGIGTLYGKSWGLNLMLISGCISLLSIPLGTALGIYTIWVFLEDQKKKRTND